MVIAPVARAAIPEMKRELLYLGRRFGLNRCHSPASSYHAER
jgi:hypothetical protein